MPEIKHSVQLAAKPDAIYPLIATAMGFGQWWASDVSEPDGAVELGFFKRATVYRLRLESAKPQAQAEWKCETGDEWNGTRITFQLEPAKTGTVLRFVHAGWRSETDYFISCNTTWGELMYRLKAVAEGQSPGPLFRAADMAY